MNKRFFTPEEANRLLPFVIEDINKLQETKESFVRKAIQLRELRLIGQSGNAGAAEDEIFRLETEMEFLQLEAKTFSESIRLKGAELKDIDTGLVDFPGIIEGEEVLLCWKMGEDRIAFYHGPHDGFRGRKPIPGGEQ